MFQGKRTNQVEGLKSLVPHKLYELYLQFLTILHPGNKSSFKTNMYIYILFTVTLPVLFIHEN